MKIIIQNNNYYFLNCSFIHPLNKISLFLLSIQFNNFYPCFLSTEKKRRKYTYVHCTYLLPACKNQNLPFFYVCTVFFLYYFSSPSFIFVGKFTINISMVTRMDRLSSSSKRTRQAHPIDQGSVCDVTARRVTGLLEWCSLPTSAPPPFPSHTHLFLLASRTHHRHPSPARVLVKNSRFLT